MINSQKRLYIFLVIFYLGCSQPQKVYLDNSSQGLSLDLHSLHKGVFNSDDELDSLIANHFLVVLTKLQERSLNDLEKDSDKDIYRLTVMPTFDKPFVIIVSNSSTDSMLTIIYKRLSGIVGYQLGNIDINLVKLINKSEHTNVWKSISTNFNDSEFWKKSNKECNGADGVHYLLEARVRKNYRVMHRWSPELCQYENSEDYLHFTSFIIGLREVVGEFTP